MSPVEQRKPLGVPQGLNLAVDPAQTTGLTVSDGLRYDEVATLTGRLGRKRLELSFPNEGFGVSSTYTEDPKHLIAESGGVRGYSKFYDQRISTQVAEILTNVDMSEQDGTFGISGWIVGGEFAFDLARGHAIYIEGATGAGTLEQNTSSWRGNPTKNTLYEISYVVSATNAAADLPTLTISPGTFTQDTVNLPATIGEHRVQFMSDKLFDPTRLIITASSVIGGGASSVTLDSISVKQVRDFGIDNLPERLNILHKGTDGKVYLNGSIAGGSDGIISGSVSFESIETRAKFVTHGKDVYVIDESTRPMLFRRRPVEEQVYAGRVLYDLSDASLRWPRPESGRPSVTQVTGPENNILHGLYRFRVQFEDKFGHVTGPSMQRSLNHDPVGGFKVDYILVEYGHLLGQAPLDRVTHASVYVQFTEGGSFSSEPSSYKFVRRHKIGNLDNSADAANSVRFFRSDFDRRSTGADLVIATGDMPKMRDFVIVNDVGYGIPSYDTVFREQTREGVPGRGGATPSGQFSEGEEKQFDSTEIAEVNLDPSFLMVSEPGRPYQMQRYFPISRGSEIGIGLSTVGDVVFVHTNVGIHAFGADPPTFKRIPSSVGTLTRDSIQEDERMIRFMGDDGVPRLFNGATIEETATELLPLFDQEDYAGYYQKFDRSKAAAVSSASGKRRYYLNYPTSPDSSDVSHKPGTGGASNNIAIADMSKGRAQWAVDRVPYEMIAWLGRESRLSAVNDKGEFYFLEEGFVDEGLVGSASVNPAITGSLKWFGHDGLTTRFFRLTFEADTKGTNLTVLCRVDGEPDLTETFIVNTTRRERLDFWLPGHFKGLYMETQFSGSTTTSGRIRVYDLKVDRENLGVL